MSMQESRDVSLAPRQATAREFLLVLFRRKWIVLGIFAVTSATVAGSMLTSPTDYVSAGRVLLKRGEQSSVFDADRHIYSDWEQDLASEMELVRSEPVLKRARELLREPAAGGGSPITLRPGAVDVEVKGKSNVLAIAYQDRDPIVARRGCEVMIRAYLEYRQTVVGLTDPRQFFETEIARVDAELKSKVEERRVFADRSNIIDMPQQKGGTLNRLTSFEFERSRIMVELAAARANLAAMHELEQRPDVDVPLTTDVQGSSVLFDLRRRMIEQESRIAQIQERYRDDSPEVLNARQSLDALRAMLKREVGAELQILESRIHVFDMRIAVIDKDIAAVNAELSGLPDKESRLSQIDRDIALLQSRATGLAEKSELAKVTENTRSSVTVILLSPAGPAAPRTTRDYVRLALAPSFSLMAGVGIAFFIDGLDITVRTSGQAEEAIELPVLATLPERRRHAPKAHAGGSQPA